MPSTRPTVDPVLDILEEMGYDFDELDGDGYKRSLKEAIIKLTIKDAKDPRIQTLTEEFQKVKGSRKVQAKEKKTTISGAKLLPGTTFRPQDIKPDSEEEMAEDGGKKDDVIAFLNGDVKDKLDEINQSTLEIKDVLVTQGDLADERDDEMRQAILADKKKKREADLEKKKGIKDKLLEPITKPVGNFLNRLLKFLTMTFIGSVVNRLMDLLKDPAQFLDPIKRFFNFIIGLVNSVMKGLWDITGAPMNFIIGGINKGVASLLDALNKATGLLKIPPIPAPEIPLVPGPPQFEFIPLSKTAQEKNEAVGMAGGGLVEGMEGESGIDGVDGEAGIDGADGISSMGIDGADGISSVGRDGVDGISAVGKDGADGISSKENVKGFYGGGFVPAPYPVGDDILGSFPMQFNKGGKVPGSGNKDTVPAMLTPGEFVMSKGAVNMIGPDKLMAMNAAGGGTNQPQMMKFAGGGIVPPDIPMPNKKGGGVIVVGGGGAAGAAGGSSRSDSGNKSTSFSSSDPNNMTIPVIKSLYNIMS